LAKYVVRGGRLIDKETGEDCTTDPKAPVKVPQMRGDLPPHRAPDGTILDGRTARREYMKRHDLREVDPSEWEPKYRNEKYARANWEARQRGELH